MHCYFSDEDPRKLRCYVRLKRLKLTDKPQDRARIHTGKKQTCQICGIVVSCKYNLYRHLKVHKRQKEARATCDVCGHAFYRKSQSEIERHMRIHTGEKPYCCEICGKTFSLKHCMKSHMFVIHGTNLYRHLKVRKGQKEVRATCDVCGHAFYRKSQSEIDRHMRIHTGEKPYCCEICGKTFALKHGMKSHMLIIHGNNLNRHLKVHKGQKEVKATCDVCGHSFYRRSQSDIDRHMRIHTGEKPYICEICGKSFVLKHGMKRHMLIVHNK